MIQRVLILALFATMFVSSSNGRAQAETLVAALGQESVAIESNFTGTSLTLFGAVIRDGRTVGRPQGYDLVVVVRGPREDIVVQRKGHFGVIWLNRDSLILNDVPSYYAVQSNRALSLISSEGQLQQRGIGLTALAFEPEREVQEAEMLAFNTALIRLRLSNGLFSESPSGVNFLTDSIFSSRIALPANIRVGEYKVALYLFRDSALLAEYELPFNVFKTGFEARVFNLATQRPLVYGLLAVLAGVFAGWAAGLFFRQT
ncbi:MAG: TIGR02186 family protein [Pseudomonadota bacterium]